MPVNSLCEVHNVRVRNSWHRHIVKRTSFSSSKLTATRLYTDTSIVTCGAFLKCSFYAYIKLLTLGKQRTWNNSIRLLPAFRHLFPPLWFARVNFQAIPQWHSTTLLGNVLFIFCENGKLWKRIFIPMSNISILKQLSLFFQFCLFLQGTHIYPNIYIFDLILYKVVRILFRSKLIFHHYCRWQFPVCQHCLA